MYSHLLKILYFTPALKVLVWTPADFGRRSIIYRGLWEVILLHKEEGRRWITEKSVIHDDQSSCGRLQTPVGCAFV